MPRVKLSVSEVASPLSCNNGKGSKLIATGTPVPRRFREIALLQPDLVPVTRSVAIASASKRPSNSIGGNNPAEKKTRAATRLPDNVSVEIDRDDHLHAQRATSCNRQWVYQCANIRNAKIFNPDGSDESS